MVTVLQLSETANIIGQFLRSIKYRADGQTVRALLRLLSFLRERERERAISVRVHVDLPVILDCRLLQLLSY